LLNRFLTSAAAEKLFRKGNKANKDCSVPENRFVTFVSFYYHLSQIENAEGDAVIRVYDEAGDVIQHEIVVSCH